MEQIGMFEFIQLATFCVGVIVGLILTGYIMGRKTIIMHTGERFVKEEPAKSPPQLEFLKSAEMSKEMTDVLGDLDKEIETPWTPREK